LTQRERCTVIIYSRVIDNNVAYISNNLMRRPNRNSIPLSSAETFVPCAPTRCISSAASASIASIAKTATLMRYFLLTHYTFRTCSHRGEQMVYNVRHLARKVQRDYRIGARHSLALRDIIRHDVTSNSIRVGRASLDSDATSRATIRSQQLDRIALERYA